MPLARFAPFSLENEPSWTRWPLASADALLSARRWREVTAAVRDAVCATAGFAMKRPVSPAGAGAAAAASSGDWNAAWKLLGASAPIASYTGVPAVVVLFGLSFGGCLLLAL